MSKSTSTERMRKSRANKATNEFSDNYLKGDTHTTTENFIKGVEDRFCVDHNCSSVSINASLTNAFCECLKDYNSFYAGTDVDFKKYDDDDLIYSIKDMYQAWVHAEKECKN